MKGKEFVLHPMSPSQVLADKQNTHHGENSERVSHQKESERHKPKLSDSMMSDKKNLVLFAIKCVRAHQVSYTMSYCARTRSHKLTTLTIYLWCYLLYCRNFKMFSPMCYLWDYLHYEALSTASTSSPEHRFRTKLPTAQPQRNQRNTKASKASHRPWTCA